MISVPLKLTITCGLLVAMPALKVVPETDTSSLADHFEVVPKPKFGAMDGLSDMWAQTSQNFMQIFPGKKNSLTQEEDGSSVRLLNMNTWYGGNMIIGGTQMLANAINAADPHVVALQEIPYAQLLQATLAAMGKTYHVEPGAGDTALLSKWPINKVESVPGTDDAIVAYHLQAPLKEIVVAVTHLDWKHYAPVLARGYDPNNFGQNAFAPNGGYKELDTPVSNVQEILKEEDASGRGPAVDAFLAWAGKLPQNTPLIAAGDFNSPSHLDWTASTANDFDHAGAVVPWRHSRKLQNAGFVDSWRDFHPDPKERPGFSWPSAAFGILNTAWAPKSDERDRIDYVYHKGFTTADAALMGSSWYHVKGQLQQASDKFFLEHMPLPSDHKGLLVDLKLKP